MFKAFGLSVEGYKTFAVPAKIFISPGTIAIVGPNNAGKSNLLRCIYDLRPVFQVIANALTGGLGHMQSLNNNPVLGVLNNERIFNIGSSGPLKIMISLPSTQSNMPATNSGIWIGIEVERTIKTTLKLRVGDSEESITSINPDAGGLVLVRGARLSAYVTIMDYYQAFLLLAQSFYVGSFRNIVNRGDENTYFDLIQGTNLIQSWGQLKGDTSLKASLLVEKVTDEIRRAFNYNRLDLAITNDRNDILARIDGVPYPLAQLGSGVSQYFIVLLNLALNPRRIVLLDEPEIGLHPALQLRYIEAIENRSECLLFTTHNLGLARSSGNQVLTVSRTGPQSSSIVRDFIAIHNPIEFLGELSFAGSYDLGYKKILLVEGPTEVKLFQKIFEKFGLRHRVTIIPLGGDNLMTRKSIHALIELRRLSDSIFAIVDSERTSNEVVATATRLQFKKSCSRLGINCHILERRCVETYFPQSSIDIVFGEKIRALGAFDTPSEDWPKPLNWQLATVTERDQYQAPDLIDFVDAISNS